MDKKKVRDFSMKFSCNICDYNTCRKSQYDRHITTNKHKKLVNTAKIQHNTVSLNYNECICGRVYTHRGSLYNHKKICNYDNKIQEPNLVPDYTDLIMKLINENQELRNTVILENKELRNQITELIPKVGNNNNSNNKFNINVFLNEDCKDALTMNQFIDKIEVSISNLMLTKNKGIEEGISNIFIENMNKLSLHERPMHCTDTKRETVYIKSEGENGHDSQWEKDKENEKLKGAIKKVEGKQFKNIKKWMDEHPDWEDDPALQDEYINLLKNCTNDVNGQKVIKKLCNLVNLPLV